MMEGSDPRTLILVGKSGSGKSATGNSILGNKMFESKRCFSGVTTTCELHSRVLEDGQMLNVIDTPGFFDSSVDPGTIRDIISCIKLGIHAVLVVFAVCNRFFEEEKAAIISLQDLFGKRICDYMIVVFTGGDELEEDFLLDFPQPLKEILCLCGNRFVVFDNKTNNETKKSNQLHQLLALVNMVLEKNGGEPFTVMKKRTNELDQEPTQEELKKTKRYSEQEMQEVIEKTCADQLSPKIEMIEEDQSRLIKELKEEMARLRNADTAGVYKRLEQELKELRARSRIDLKEALLASLQQLEQEVKEYRTKRSHSDC